MKKLLTAGLLGSSLLASAALAQSAPPAQPSSGPDASPAPGFLTRLEPGQMLASEIMDQDVLGADSKEIGDVEDVVPDRSGRVVALIVEVDEGLGERTVAVPLSAIQLNAADPGTTGSVQSSGSAGSLPAARRSDDMRIVVTIPTDQLKSAPEFDEDGD